MADARFYYQIGRGNTSYLFALLAPGMGAQTLFILLFHGSLTVVAQLVFAANVGLLAASLLPVVLPHLGSPPVLRRQAASGGWRSTQEQEP